MGCPASRSGVRRDAGPVAKGGSRDFLVKNYAVIRNQESDKNVAVLIHDDELGRSVFKCRDADWPLQKAFDVWADKPLVVHESCSHNGQSFVVRRKVTRFERDYLIHLLDKFVKRPYGIRDIRDSSSTIRLDDFADEMAEALT